MTRVVWLLLSLLGLLAEMLVIVALGHRATSRYEAEREEPLGGSRLVEQPRHRAHAGVARHRRQPGRPAGP